VAQRVVGGDAGAQQRPGVLVGEVVGHRGQRARLDHHVVGIAAVHGDSGDLHVLAVDEIAAATPLAVAAVAAKPAEADALADLPPAHALTERFDGTSRSSRTESPPAFLTTIARIVAIVVFSLS
jgi:hypothetical protein